jgi:hypothetical protein
MQVYPRSTRRLDPASTRHHRHAPREAAKHHPSPRLLPRSRIIRRRRLSHVSLVEEGQAQYTSRPEYDTRWTPALQARCGDPVAVRMYGVEFAESVRAVYDLRRWDYRR